MTTPLHPMSGSHSASIIGVGSYIPDKILTNHDLEKMVETSDEWIFTRTGIRERRIAAEGELTSDMGAGAALKAMASAGVAAGEIDLIIVATATPDMLFPSTACWIQQKIGATRAAAFDLTAACSGFLYALAVGDQFVRTGLYKTVLVIGAEKLSTIIDWKDRNTCVLFGDAAGAVVLRHEPERAGIMSLHLGSDGRQWEVLNVPGGGCRHPTTEETLKQGLQYMHMSGRDVFKLAVVAMQTAALKAIETAGIKTEDIACIIPHQANIRIIESIADRLGVGMDRMFINLDRFGNTSSATIPVALDEAFASDRIKRGDKILMVAFGGGLTWASAVVEW